MFTKSNLKRLFLDASTPYHELSERVDVILSPSLYWVKRVTLPVKYLYEVKKLLPAIFEEILPEGNYSYHAYREGDGYIAFAYDDRVILELLQAKGLGANSVEKLYFAQSELSNLEGAYRVNETQSLTVKEGICVLLPSIWTPQAKELDLEPLKLSKHNVTLSEFGHIVDSSSLTKYGVVVLLFALLFGFESYLVASKSQALQEERSALFERYGLKSTTMQNESLLASYEKRHTRQMALRSSIAKILALRLREGDRVVLMEYRGDKLLVEVALSADAAYFEPLLKKSGLSYKISRESGKAAIEVAL